MVPIHHYNAIVDLAILSEVLHQLTPSSRRRNSANENLPITRNRRMSKCKKLKAVFSKYKVTIEQPTFWLVYVILLLT